MRTKTKTQPVASQTGLVVGSILSETSFYVVEGFQPGDKVVVHDDFGHQITLGKRYVEEICTSADQWTTEEPKTMTELQELFLGHPRMAMTVCYITKETEKPKKEYEAEKQAKIVEIQNASLANTGKLLNELIENPITKTIPGHIRVMKGRHYGNPDGSGRVNFVDMELKKDPSKDYDTRLRQVDPRTIQWLVINKVKYFRK